MKSIITLVLLSSIITYGFSNPKKPKKCTTYSCTDWDWKNKKGLFDPHTIQWPLHHTGETYLDKVDGGNYDIDVVFNYYAKKIRVPLKDYRNSKYHSSAWYLDEGIKMHDAFVCVEGEEDKPYWTGNSCAMIGVTHEDKFISIGGPSCGKIVREWAIVDWCKWEPNTQTNTRAEKYSLVKDIDTHKVYWAYGAGHYDIEHDGWYTFKQVIKILDKDPPGIAYCDDIEVDLEGECHTKVKLTNKVVDSGPCPGEKMEVELTIIRDDGLVILTDWVHAKNKETFYVNLGYLPAGIYKIHWSVKDGCGNDGACIQKLKVIDKNPPHLICIQDLSTSIKDEDGATIWAEDFIHKVTGACYDEYLTYSFYKDSVVTSLTFDCEDGVGLNELEVFVTGSNGVTASCNATIFVADHAQCDPDAMQIAGKVTTKFSSPIAGAEVMVQAASVIINSDMTNDNGIYGVNGISFDLGRPEIVAKVVEDNPSRALDGVDLIFLLRHIYDIEKLKNSDQRAAADVNSDGAIDMEDYWDLVDIIYDIPGREANINSWKFYDDKFGLFAGFDHMRLVEPVKLARYRHEYSLIGLKTGDIDFSWRPDDVAGNRSTRRSSQYKSSIDYSGHVLEIQIPDQAEVKSLRLVGYNISYTTIESVKANGSDLAYVIEEVAGQQQLYILSSQDLSSSTININSNSEVGLSGSGKLYESVGSDQTLAIDWQLNLSNNTSDQSLLISPNPVDDQYALSFNSAENGRGTIEIYSTSGQLIMRNQISISSGYNEYQMTTDELSSGLYLIIISTPTERSSIGRMVKN